ncbi:hypothetical protein UXN85_21050 [Enterobacter hormaechei]
MLDDAKQVAAFKLLQKAAGRTAHNYSMSSGTIQTVADNQRKALEKVIDAAKAQHYPANVKTQFDRINSVITLLGDVEKKGVDVADLLKPYTTIHQLVNLSIGFDCYVKAYSLPTGTPFALVDAIAQAAPVDNLVTALNALAPADVVAKATAVNAAIVQAPAATPPASGGGTWSAPTAQQVTDLTTAINTMEVKVTAIRTALTAFTKLHTDALAAIDQAQQAFNDAVEIALIVALKSDARMAAAIAALVPANVLAALA